jgi:hypothetical protein
MGICYNSSTAVLLFPLVGRVFLSLVIAANWLALITCLNLLNQVYYLPQHLAEKISLFAADSTSFKEINLKNAKIYFLFENQMINVCVFLSY